MRALGFLAGLLAISGCVSAQRGPAAPRAVSAQGLTLALPDGLELVPVEDAGSHTRFTFRDAESRCHGELNVSQVRDAGAHERAVRAIIAPRIAHALESRGMVPRETDSRTLLAGRPARLTTYRMGTGISTGLERDVLLVDAFLAVEKRGLVVVANCPEPTLVHTLLEDLAHVELKAPALAPSGGQT